MENSWEWGTDDNGVKYDEENINYSKIFICK